MGTKCLSGSSFFKFFSACLIAVCFYVLSSGFEPDVKTNQLSANINTAGARIMPPNGQPRNFINCIFNFDPELASGEWITDHLSKYNELNFNTIHTYDNINGAGMSTNNGTNWYGQFDPALTTQQKTNLDNLTNSIEQEELNLWFERCKISKLCYAQRLVYEVKNPNGYLVNNGFCYQDCDGDYITDQGNTVLHLTPVPSSPQPKYIAKDIYENLQHGDNTNFSIQLADRWTWYIKPRMRIPTNTPDNKEVVKVEIVNYQGTVLKTITIKSQHFKDGNGNYGGQYIEKYNLDPGELLEVEGGYHTQSSMLNTGMHAGRWLEWAANCSTDFRIKWMDEVEVWFDKTTVDDVFANIMFKPERNDNFDLKIIDELLYYKNGRNYTLFADECLYSNIPCIKYVQDKIEYFSDSLDLPTTPKLNIAISHFLNVRGTKDANEDEKTLKEFLSVVQPIQFSADIHELYGWRESETQWYYGNFIPNTIDNSKLDTRITTSGGLNWVRSYDTYTSYVQDWVLGYTGQSTSGHEEGSLLYQLGLTKDQIENYSPDTRIIVQPQIQGVMALSGTTTKFIYGAREPFNEEIQAQAMVSIAHGADGICWYVFQSEQWNTFPPLYNRRYDGPEELDNYSAQDVEKTYGLQAENMTDRREHNLYSQNKWDYISEMNLKIKKWKPFLDIFTESEAFSVHQQTQSHNYISEVKSIKRDASPPYNFGTTEDATKYWEMGFFEHDLDGDFNIYFMMVNRRTAPEYTDDPGKGDLRQLHLKFNGSDPHLAGINNWRIYDVEDNEYLLTINKNSNSFYNLGTFNPGEGRMFRMVPVFVSGGTLVTDENISAKSLTCLDTVLNGGYNITIDSNSTISFTDSATIIMSGGTFTSGVHGEDNLTTYKGIGSANWNGLRFTGSTVKIYNSRFQDIASPCVNYAVKLVNCLLGDIRTNEFALDTDTAGAVQSVYSSSSIFSGLYINYNSVEMNNSRGNSFTIQGFSGLTLPVYLMNNTMTSNGYASGILLSTITGGAVKKNEITGYSTGINSLFSTTDIYNNIISNTSAVSKGITASSSSSLNLKNSAGLWLGGFNYFANSSGSSKNIDVSGSVFYLDGGNNMFYVSNTSGAYHLYGSFWEDSYPADHRSNCFTFSSGTVSSSSTPSEYITDGSSQLSLTYTAYACNETPPTGVYIADIGNGLYDTIPSNSEGPGGGGRGSSKNSGYVTLTPSQLYDSVRINIRKQNYTAVKLYALELIEDHPGTYEAVSSLQSLYMAAAAVDTTSSGITALKTFYETLILNNGSNTALVKISYYLAQKCKVLLGDYSSAMSGFQQIINNNPYSYEGLVARWDYMATSLMAPGGGGEPDVVGDASLNTNNGAEEEFFGDDKSPFTKEQKQQIHSSVKTAFETAKSDDDRKIKTLEDKAATGDETAKHELNQLRTLKELIKSEKPRDITQHIAIVSSDLQKAFGNTAPVINKPGIVPVEFSLSQNYPNPFNPITTIKYALPNDVKVVMKVYDILGREVRTLVNEPQKAGYYDIKFDGSACASGVYFYRIEAGDYVVSKKMMLVK